MRVNFIERCQWAFSATVDFDAGGFAAIRALAWTRSIIDGEYIAARFA
jgi:hypothetical protein